ncbi:MAG: TRAP transporter small permease [Deltaproteobacteria bacterium]|nr:TRAP transporter small permease [Deltaproteobacteria bacterium]
MRLLRYYKSFSENLYLGSKYAVALLLAGTVTCIFFQVIFRYVFDSPLTWSEELSRIFFVWMCLIGSGIASRNIEHMSIDVFVKKFPVQWQRVLGIFISGILVIFMVIVIIYGLKLVVVTKTQISSGTRIPVSFLYLSVPVGFGLMLLYTLEAMMNLLTES